MSLTERRREDWNTLANFLNILISEGGSYFSYAEQEDLRRLRNEVRFKDKISSNVAQKTLLYSQMLEERGLIHFESRYMNEIKRIVGAAAAEPYEPFEKEILKRMREAAEKKAKLKVVFMFGSGASRSPPSNIPTVSEMLDYLVEKLPPTEVPFTSKVRDWAARKGVNIEDILTAGYLGTLLVSKPIVSKLVGEIIYRESREEFGELREREYVFSFQELVGRIFSMVSGMMANADSNKIHETIASMMKVFGNDDLLDFSVVTTNYDVCIEKAFEKNGLKYNYLGVTDGQGIPLVKMHGSINWFYCEGCQSVITYSIDELAAFKKIYPTSGSCNKCGTASSLLMVPPIAYKYVMYPPLIDIWQAAMKTIENADVIIAVGYSFSLSDDYILKMIVSGLKKKGSILVLLNKDIGVVENLGSKLSAYHLRLSFPFIGDAIETAPKIVDKIKEARAKVLGEKVPVLPVEESRGKKRKGTNR